MRWLALILILTGAFHATADRLTPYSSRPKISDVASGTEGVSVRRRNLMLSVHHFVVELKGLYANRKFYFLGRDGELIFDLWSLMFPEDLASGRIQLINVSSIAMEDPNLRFYLVQEGLDSRSTALAPLLVDSGYEGKIVDKINLTLGYGPELNILGHLMSSTHEQIPSSRVAGSFFLKAARANQPEDHVHSEAGDIVVKALEGVAHYTLTAQSFAVVNDRWQPMSKPSGAEQRSSALRTMAQTRTFFETCVNNESDRRIVSEVQKLISALSKDEPLDPDRLVHLAAELQNSGYGELWGDLRETIGKGNLSVKSARWNELWSLLPGGLPGLNDIDEPPAWERIRETETALLKTVKSAPVVVSPKPEFSVLDTLRHYLSSKVAAEELRRNQVLNAFKHQLKEQRGLIFEGVVLPLGEKLGEGIRADVYELGSNLALKVAYEGEDTAALELEKRVYEHLRANPKKYPVRMVPILAAGEDGTFLLKPRFNRANLAKKLLKNGKELSLKQRRSLENIFQTAKSFAEETGIALDIKPDNLLWDNGEFSLVDLGPRTFFQPYFFSLEMSSFDEFLKSWMLDRESRVGTFMDVEDFLRKKNWDCEESLLEGYREMKADRN